MNFYIGILILLNTMCNRTIFNFNSNSDLTDWEIVNDVVMGGKSFSDFTLNSDGNGVFSGKISLENNGGFSSVHFQFKKMEVHSESKIVIKLKGDGKKYQLRVKSNSKTYYSYITYFSTNGEWQEIVISLKDMYPQFRGKKMDQPNFSHPHLEQLSFLIANKKSENFILLIDKIELL